ncbi:MAG: type II toxin-antitoxin system RelE/ParE family toxin [Candidatus Kerfeldbacteria bacterium]|nr:type II toxin-antitoxin system RelE/ParE family toxin [Candidatus Kerfeldbacteria bacterium]
MLELRVRGRQEVRILYTFHGNVAALLHGFIKKSATIPPKDLQLGFYRMRNLT